ncbi:MAG: helix-turn-helix domain-containing protein [Oscillospiraceae bacterium]
MSAGANRLRELRKRIGKSQEIVGGLLNISQSRMSDYENGICAIPSDALILFADYYKVTTDYILGLSDNSSCVQCTDITDEEYSKLMALRTLSGEQKVLVEAMIKAACTVIK